MILLFAVLGSAQRAYVQKGQVIYENARGAKTSLGRGHGPVPVSEDKILFIRGADLGYGDRAACAKPEAKNRVVLYDARTKHETILYDKPLTNEFAGPDDACIFLQADLSPSGSTLYIVTPWAATSNRLVMIDLNADAESHEVDGAIDVFVIRGGSSEGDLIYRRRLWESDPRDGLSYPHYPFIHANPDGWQIAIVSDEYFTVGATEKTPILRAYLRKLQGRIYVDGRWIP